LICIFNQLYKTQEN